jgi:hypothetical protein
MYKNPRESQGVYENLSRGSMYELFTSKGELKEGYKQSMDEGSSHFQGGTQHCSILSKHPEVEELIIQTLKGHRKAGQPLSARFLLSPSLRRRLQSYFWRKDRQLLWFSSNGLKDLSKVSLIRQFERLPQL